MTAQDAVATVVGLAAYAATGLVGRGSSGWRPPAGRGGSGTARGWGMTARPSRRRRRPHHRHVRRSTALVGRRAPGGRGARWARRGDLAPLDVGRGGPPAGRLVIGRSGGRLLAAERVQSVVVFGPTQSRKTSGFAVPAILEWQGPVVATSVKTDLVRDTIGHRRSRGDVACYDPTGVTGLATTTWSPLPASATWPGARRAAAALIESARNDAGPLTDGDFWYATAAKLLAPLLFAAAVDGRGMADVRAWLDTQEEREVLAVLDATGESEAVNAAEASFAREARQRSSVYTTAETVLDPFAEQVVPATSGSDGTVGGPCELDAAGLLDGGGTLYVCAPAHDQRRWSPLFTAVVREVLTHAVTRVARTGTPLDPPLLVVLDEAANIAPLSDLDTLASTAAGHGIQLVTVWHDLAQVSARYGARAATVVNNHRAKVFLSGISDPSTLEHASALIGDEEPWATSTTSGGPGGPTTTRAPSARRLAPPDALRRIAPGEGVLVYGGLLPARITLRSWMDDPGLAVRARPPGVPRAGRTDGAGA